MRFSFKHWPIFFKTIFVITTGVVAALTIFFLVAVFAPEKVRAALKDIGWAGETVSAILPPPLPAAQVSSKAYWLKQNWSARERFWFHHASQGTATFPVPYDWFVSLERAELAILSTPRLLSDGDYLIRFGFIPSPRRLDSSASDFGYSKDASNTQTSAEPEQFKDYPENPDGLPVGFAKLEGGIEPSTGEPYPAQLGFTCAACHTGQIRYRDVNIRFDGGPAMVNLGNLESAIGLSIFYTVYVPTRFDRFADRVIERAVKAGSAPADRSAFKEELKRKLRQTLDKIKRERDWSKAILARGNMTYIDEGFGRLDALNRIGNQLFFSDLLPSDTNGNQGFPQELARNYARPDAPVSFPPIWDVPWFLWAQYDGSVQNELVRNAGQSLGVKTKLNLTEHSDPNRPLFRSSMKMKNIFWIEEMLRGPDPFADNTPGQEPKFKGLVAPRWKEAADIFQGDPAWQVDDEKVSNGRRLYAELCVECHRGPVRDPEFDKERPDLSFWRAENPDRTEKNWVKIGDRSFFNVVEKPVAVMGTDRQQSRVLSERQVYLPPSLGVNPTQQLNAQWSCDLPPNDEALNALFTLALMAVVDKSIDQWFKDNPVPAELEKIMRGERRNCQNKKAFKPIAPVDGKPANPPVVLVPHYRARPLDGVWATAPYLHNGSVPTLYDLLIPQHLRPQVFCVGSREFDPVKVGLPVKSGEACATGLTRFDVTGLGNSNLGHSFEGTETDKTKLSNGVIGRGLTDAERDALVQYLKTL
ncbi:di-heme-cytochrome C peroxidase [Nitrobacter sp.]|uniref:di-heme-cytochrome C peroxidase n=1 Tax=Nitrobacter sp. TaxID=29420 RepID=UPI0029CABBD9|nr:di-heme-cytochrome C peroxidase [Nitrobacter sp.]